MSDVQNPPETLESALKRLQDIVSTLERNNASLDECLKLFEEGVSLTRFCNDRLAESKKKVEILTQITDTGVRTQPFEDEE